MGTHLQLAAGSAESLGLARCSEAKAVILSQKMVLAYKSAVSYPGDASEGDARLWPIID